MLAKLKITLTAEVAVDTTWYSTNEIDDVVREITAECIKDPHAAVDLAGYYSIQVEHMKEDQDNA